MKISLGGSTADLNCQKKEAATFKVGQQKLSSLRNREK